MLATYKFVFNRKNASLKRGETSVVQLRITANRRARFLSTGIYIEKHQWADKDGAWIVNHLAEAEYNAFLTEILSRVKKAGAMAEVEGRTLSYDAIKGLVRNNIDSGSFIDFMERDSQSRSDISLRTKSRARVMMNKLRKFNVTQFSDLTYENVVRINNELLKTEMVSTADKFHATVMTYIRRAISLGLMPMDKDPYLRFKRQRPKEAKRRFLSKEELEKIEGKKLPLNRLDFVRDMFVFSCYTGLSYSDLQELKPENIVKTGQKQFIKIFRQKTDEAASIYLLSKPLALLKKYEGRREGYCFPSISNQKLNAYLKEIAALSGVDKELTAHMARHTFATTVMLANGVSLEVTQKALGHSNIRTTQIYAKMLDDRVAEEMGKLEGK